MFKKSEMVFKVISTILLVMPIFFIPSSVATLEPLKTFIVLIAGTIFLGMFIGKSFSHESCHTTRNPLILASLGVILAAGVSALFSDVSPISFFGRQISYLSFAGLVSLFGLTYAFCNFFKERKDKTFFFLSVYSVSIVVCVLHLSLILIPAIPSLGFFYGATTNTIGSWGELGFFALFTVLSSIIVLQFLGKILLYRFMGIIGMIFGTVLFLVVGYPILLFSAMFCAAFILVIDSVLSTVRKKKKTFSIPVLVLLVVTVIFIFFGGIITPNINAVLNLETQEVRPSLLGTYGVTKSVLQDSPVSGEGLQRFDIAWLRNQEGDYTSAGQFWEADFNTGYSTVTSVGVTQGILGMVAWLAFIVCIIYYAYKLLVHEASRKADFFMNVYVASGTLFFLLVRIIYNPSIVLTALFFIFLGVFIACLKQAELLKIKPVEFKKNNLWIPFFQAASLLALLVGVLYVAYVQVSQYTSRVLFDNATQEYYTTGNAQELLTNIEKARMFFDSDVYGRLGVEAGIIAINQTAQDENLSPEQILAQIELILGPIQNGAIRTLLFDPRSYRNHLILLELYKNLIVLNAEGAEEQARVLLERISELTPGNPRILLEKARIQLLKGEPEKALVKLDEALGVKPNYVEALSTRSQILNSQNNTEAAIADLILALQISPQNEDLYLQLGAIYYSQGNFSSAAAIFQQLVQVSPGFSEGIYFYGLSLYQNGNENIAIEVLEQLTERLPNNSEIAATLERMKLGENISQTTAPEEETLEDSAFVESEIEQQDGELEFDEIELQAEEGEE